MIETLGANLLWLVSGRRRLRPVCAFLVLTLGGCGTVSSLVLPNENTDPVDTGEFALVARFVHISDAQICDEQSPGRLTVAAHLVATAWRPHEAYSLQLLDGFVRTVNRMHVAQHPIDFLIHTGDATDNAQLNETRWFVSVLDGGSIDPQSAPDDRPITEVPLPELDPYAPFVAQGLYRNGVHGPAKSIRWYSVMGNHDRFASGVFPIVTGIFGDRYSPMPAQDFFGFTIPSIINPIGTTAWAPISPASPGPPPFLNLATQVQANADRRFVTDEEFIAEHFASEGLPTGHGFSADRPGEGWYSVEPVAGLRLIGLNSSTPPIEWPGLVYSEGALSFAQRKFLRRELDAAQARDEVVVIATHHPSGTLQPIYGSSLGPNAFRSLLDEYPNVALHICGHLHRNVVFQRGHYVEMETGSTLDSRQLGRVVEIWKGTETIELRYRFLSHLDELASPSPDYDEMFADPLRELRTIAFDLANGGINQLLFPDHGP